MLVRHSITALRVAVGVVFLGFGFLQDDRFADVRARSVAGWDRRDGDVGVLYRALSARKPADAIGGLAAGVTEDFILVAVGMVIAAGTFRGASGA